jgi:hypothetical protein
VAGTCLAALVSAGCVNLSRPPRDVVTPTVAGLWRSSVGLGNNQVRMTVQSGDSFVVDEEKSRLRVGGPGANEGALVLYGDRPSPWYILAPLADPIGRPQEGCHDDSRALLYDEPDAVVMRPQTAAGDWATFGIRLMKRAGAGPEIQTPLPEDSGFYGFRRIICLGDRGEVTYIGF